ncbi:MAG TPA: NfeD family protein [Candidatus Acidoferrum sp.]|nr:NfeD family protein [Candidatus Acidoferrum sp.]
MVLVWLVLTVIFLVAEGLTFGLTTLWFALGSLVALLAAFIRLPVPVQVILFIVVSAASLLLLRPIINGVLKVGRERTNADRVIGKTARVTETIDNIQERGQVRLDGQVWTARSDSGECIERGREAVVLRITGVKLIVKSVPEPPPVQQEPPVPQEPLNP